MSALGDTGRIPPQNLEAEMAVLGAMMVERDMIDVVAGLVQPIDFYAHVHETIATIIFALHAAGQPVDKISVAGVMRSQGRLDALGGLSYLSSLLDAVPTAASANYYATLVSEKARLRRLLSAAAQIESLAYNGEDDVDATCSDADRILREALDAGCRPSGGVTIQNAIRATFQDLERLAAGDDTLAVQTPWPTVNERVGGFYPGELIVLASAPAMGKTGAVLTLADYISRQYGPVAFFSLEMTVEAISRRWLALHSEVTARNQRLTPLRDYQWDRVGDAMSVISTRKAVLFGRRQGTIEGIRRELSAMQRVSGRVRAIMIDHVGFIGDNDQRNAKVSEHDRLDRTYRRLLDVADEFGTTIFAVQHVNREGSKPGVRPTMAQIRGGGNAEGHAHAILFPYREDPMSEDREIRKRGEIIVAKARDGEEGPVAMRFYGHRHLWVEGDEKPDWLAE